MSRNGVQGFGIADAVAFPDPGVEIVGIRARPILGDGAVVEGGEVVPNLGDGAVVEGGEVVADPGGWTLLVLADSVDGQEGDATYAGRIANVSQDVDGWVTADITGGSLNTTLPSRSPYWRWVPVPQPGGGTFSTLDLATHHLEVALEIETGAGLWGEPSILPQVTVGAFAGLPQNTGGGGTSVGLQQQADGTFRLIDLQRISSSSPIAGGTTATRVRGRIWTTTTRSLGSHVVGLNADGTLQGPPRSRSDDSAATDGAWRVFLLLGSGAIPTETATVKARAWYRLVRSVPAPWPTS